MKAADAVDCDGPGALNPYFPPLELYATYGIAWHQATKEGSGTQADPYWQYPGSFSYPAPDTVTRYMAEIKRPAETSLINDGVTMVGGGYFVITFGCESAEMHQQGGNHVFLDGHAKRIARNPERYLKQNAQGAWFKQYFCFSEE